MAGCPRGYPHLGTSMQGLQPGDRGIFPEGSRDLQRTHRTEAFRAFQTTSRMTLPFDERQPLVAAEVGVGQPVLVEAELVEDRRVDVAEVVGALDGPEADGVGGADDLAPLDPAAGHPHREAEVVVVAPLARFGLGRAAELAAPDDERAVEQPPALQVLEQGGDGPVGLGGLAGVVLLDVVVGVPLEVARPRRRRRRRRTGRRSRRASGPAGSGGRSRASAPGRPRRGRASRAGSRERSRTSGASDCIRKARS